MASSEREFTCLHVAPLRSVVPPPRDARAQETRTECRAMAACKMREVLAAMVSAVLFCVASSGIIMLNKWIISVLGFPFPMTLSLLGMLFSLTCSAALTKLTSLSTRNVEITVRFCLLRAAPIGVLTALTLYFGNLAYVDLSVSFLQMLKARE